MADRASGTSHAMDFLGVEDFLIEVDGLRGILANDGRGDGMESFRDGTDSGHKSSFDVMELFAQAVRGDRVGTNQSNAAQNNLISRRERGVKRRIFLAEARRWGAIRGANDARKMTTVVFLASTRLRTRVEEKENRECGGGKNAIRLSGGDLCDGTDQGRERVERISRPGYGSTPARGR